MKLINELANAKSIVFFGDSITNCEKHELHAPLGTGYVHRLIKRLDLDHPSQDRFVVNSGINGDTVTGLLRRVQTDVLEHAPDFLFIKIGINDAYNNFHYRSASQQGLDSYRAEYNELLAVLVRSLPDLRVLLITPYYIMDNDADLLKQHMCAYGAIVGELALAYNIPIFDSQRLFDDACKLKSPIDWAHDFIHPIVEGHQLLADKLYEILCTMESS